MRRVRTTDATSVVGISQQVGAVSAAGGWNSIFFLFGFVTVFIGLINLLPLPPFDGGHLAMLGDREAAREADRWTCAR